MAAASESSSAGGLITDMAAAGLPDHGFQLVEGGRADAGELVVAGLLGVIQEVGFHLGAAKQATVDFGGGLGGFHRLTKGMRYYALVFYSFTDAGNGLRREFYKCHFGYCRLLGIDQRGSQRDNGRQP